MYKKIICAFVLWSCVANIQSFKFPKDIERCTVGDTDCITRVTNDFISTSAKKGHSGINLIPIDPLHIPSIAIKQGAESPVNIELKFTDADILGMSDSRFYKIDGFQADATGKYELNVKAPVLYLVGPYTISGRVLVLPIQGEGNSNTTLIEPDLTMTFDGKSVKRNNQEYLQIENAKLKFTVKKIIFDFQNLYNGDKVLGDSTNKFLNENWNDIFQEIKANVFDAYALITENVLRNVFNKVPYNDLFAPQS